MKNNGFTIVELMASIAILAIIITLGVCCVNVISEKILKSNYESKKSLIEIKASEYASDTGFLFTNVDNLVKLGYLSSDDKNDNVINPLNQESLNCRIVKIVNENDNLYATLTEEEECNNDSILQTNMHLGINILKTSDNSRVDNNTWINEDVILEAYFKDLNIVEDNIKKVIWRTNAFTDEKEVADGEDFRAKNKYLVSVSQIINSTYYVEIVLNDNTVYYAKTIVKVDKQAPVIYDDSIKVTLGDSLTSSDHKLKFAFTDSYGAGPSSYSVGLSPDCNVGIYEILENDKSSFEVPITAGNIYYICLKDKVGNYAEPKKVDLKDFKAPIINNIEDTLNLGKEDYEFRNNVYVDFGIFEGHVSCSPTISKKTGDYDVTCTAISKNGLSANTTFNVHHLKEE